MNEEKETKLCDLCNEKEGTIWCHSDGGIGSPIRYGLNLHFCQDCNKNKTSEIEALRLKKLAENRVSCTENLKNQIYNQNMRSGMVHYTQMYWFKHESNTISEFEDYLGFKLPDWFCQWIQNLTCDQCRKKIQKKTEREQEKIFQRLNPKQLSFSEIKDNPIECRKIKEALQGIFVARKFLKSRPELPEQLKSIPINQLNNHPDYAEYQKLYDEYTDSKVLKHFCSRKCLDKALKKDKDLGCVLF
jgi:hypothetical protein